MSKDEEAFDNIAGTYDDIAGRYLLKPKATIDKLNSGEKVNSIPFEILRRIIEDDEYYNYAMKTFEHDFFFRMGVPHNGDISNIMIFEKQDILNGLAELLNSGRILASKRAVERFNNLCNSNDLSLDELRKTHVGEITVVVNEKDYTFKYKDIFDYIENPSDEKIASLSDDAKKAFKDLFHFFVRNIIKSRNGTLVRVKINPKLREALFEGMPDDYTIPERAIFLYLRLCELLTYSDDYYSFCSLDEISEKFESFDTIESVTPENNDTVCYRSDIIYTRLLGELGVGLDEDKIFEAEENYGIGHPKSNFIIYDFKISADPLKSASNSDLMGVKFNANINGLQCLSPKKETREKFGELLSKTYKRVQQIKMEKEENKHRFDTFKEGYRLLTSNFAPVSFDERVDILTYSINSTGFKGLDAIGNLIRLTNSVFTEEQNENNVNLAIVCNLDVNNIRKIGTTNVVISVNKDGFNINPDGTVYYLYNPGHPLEKISKEKLQIKCGIGTICIVAENHSIPGIVNYEDNTKERLGLL